MIKANGRWDKKRLGKRWWSLTGFFALLALITALGSALAEDGTGSHKGIEKFVNQPLVGFPPGPPCTKTKMSYKSYDGRPGKVEIENEATSYSFDITVTFATSDGSMNPAGTYSDTSCTGGTGGIPITTASIEDGPGGDELACNWAEGSFKRDGLDETIVFSNGRCEITPEGESKQTVAATAKHRGGFDPVGEKAAECANPAQFPPEECPAAFDFTLTVASLPSRTPRTVSVAPSALPQGTENQNVAITGADFAPGATVSFGTPGIKVNSTRFINDVNLTADISITADAQVGSTDVTVTNPGGAAGSCGGCFRVTPAPPPPQGPPSVSSVFPASLPQGATARTVIIDGTNFSPGASASFSGTGITVNSSTLAGSNALQLSLTISADAPTVARDVTVTNPDGASGSCGRCFTPTAASRVPSAQVASIIQPRARAEAGAPVELNPPPPPNLNPPSKLPPPANPAGPGTVSSPVTASVPQAVGVTQPITISQPASAVTAASPEEQAAEASKGFGGATAGRPSVPRSASKADEWNFAWGLDQRIIGTASGAAFLAAAGVAIGWCFAPKPSSPAPGFEVSALPQSKPALAIACAMPSAKRNPEFSKVERQLDSQRNGGTT